MPAENLGSAWHWRRPLPLRGSTPRTEAFGSPDTRRAPRCWLSAPPPAVGHSSPSPSRSFRHVVVDDHDEGLGRGVVHVDGVFARVNAASGPQSLAMTAG